MKCWGYQRCCSCTKDYFVGKVNESEEGARDIGERFLTSPCLFAMASRKSVMKGIPTVPT